MKNGKIEDNKEIYIVQRTKKSKIVFTVLLTFLQIIFLGLIFVENRVDLFSGLCTVVIIGVGVMLLNIHRYRLIVCKGKVLLRPTFGKEREYVLKGKDLVIKKNSDSVYSVYNDSKRMLSINLYLENSTRLLCEIIEINRG